MRKLCILIGLWVCVYGSVLAQTSVLERRVSLQYQDVSLEQIISELKRNYGVNFSYVNNRIPLQQKVSVRITNQPLKVALDELFKNVNVTYQLVGDQVVLKNEVKKSAENTEDTQSQSTIQKIPYVEPLISEHTLTPHPVLQPDLVAQLPPVKTELAEPYKPIIRIILPRFMHYAEDIKKHANQLKETLLASNRKDYAATDSALSEEVVDQAKLEQATVPQPDTLTRDSAENSITEDDPEGNGYTTRPFQVTFFPPLSTNGLEAGKVVNQISLNVLAGHAAGLTGVEFGGFVNIEKDFVRGAQFAGFSNVVGNTVIGAQFAGFANINGGFTQAAQFAGFTNIVGRGAEAVQFAGFANIAGGDVRGGQFAGFANISNGSITGPQVAGFININAGTARGAQIAGFTNISRRDVHGAQIAGFLNYARRLKGVQIGLINVAGDADQGVQIGFLSISRYLRLELWGSETFYGNMALKTGSRNFYNIFAVGVQIQNGYYRWGYGYGFGSEIRMSNTLALNLDALAYHVNENEVFTDELNLLNQFRANLGIRLAGRTYLFLGPTFNVMISQYQPNEGGEYGSAIVPSWATYNYTDGRTNVQMWPGFNLGIRF